MTPGVRTRFLDRAETRPLAIIAAIGCIATTAAAAAPLSGPVGYPAVTTAVAATPATQSDAPPAVELVWRGEDMDGDGRDDFTNPTGHMPRGHDAYGEGEFGARRDGGSRRHEGVDYVAEAGQAVGAPISGYVTKIGYAYAGDRNLKFVEVTNPALRVAARIFYVNPKVQVGEAVAMGAEIGTARSLQRKYRRGMTDHVHLEIIDRRGLRIDAAKIITAEYRPVETAIRVATAD